jgi:glycerate dehydrogenase
MKIVVLDGYALNPGDLSWEKLETMGDVTVYDRTPGELTVERAFEAEIVLTNKTLLMAETIKRLPKLKYIGVLATGYNVVDTKTASEHGITVTNIPAYSTFSVVQMVFALILELCHHVQNHSDAVRSGEWANSKDFAFWKYPLVELAGKNMGIIGFGEIGKRVALVASAFGMNVLVHSRTKREITDIDNCRWVDMEEIITTSDVVSLHCPLTNETAGLINKEVLEKMKPSAFLINTSRGGVIADKDVAEALNSGRIAGVGIDVLTTEPPAKDNPMLTAKNCLITPHIAWATKEARLRLMDIASNNVKTFIEGNPINVINK